MGILFFLNSVLLGAGLAADAFSVSLANGLNEPEMSRLRMCAVAGTYAFFQFFMPMAGWVCVHTIVECFSRLQIFIPWIALILLLYIGGKMIFESAGKRRTDGTRAGSLSAAVLLLQGVATSIDALSAGFTTAAYNPRAAVVSSLIIAAVTFLICFSGLAVGKRAGTRLSGKAGILGGAILVLIGIEIFVRGVIL